MSDHFKIDAPTCISFSGGRTSAYMLWRVLQSNNGLPDEAIVCFANTGKEEEATLEFVRDCSANWSVPVTWVEYKAAELTEDQFRVVDFDSASRNGEPFEAVIRRYKTLPNVRNKACTSNLKYRATARYLTSIGWTEWDNFVGLRADEPRRAAKLRPDRKAETPLSPLYRAGVSIRDVDSFWATQAFRLNLPTPNGRTLAGNCDLCFLKPLNQIQTLIQERPERAAWWIRMENLARQLNRENGRVGDGERFSLDRPSYAQMLKFSEQQQNLFDPQEEGIPCFCGD